LGEMRHGGRRTDGGLRMRGRGAPVCTAVAESGVAAAGGDLSAEDEAEEGGLARAVGPQERHPVPGLEREGEVYRGTYPCHGAGPFAKEGARFAVLTKKKHRVRF